MRRLPEISAQGRIMAAIGVICVSTFPATGWQESLAVGIVALTALAMGMAMAFRPARVRAVIHLPSAQAVAGEDLRISMEASNPSTIRGTPAMACALRCRIDTSWSRSGADNGADTKRKSLLNDFRGPDADGAPHLPQVMLPELPAGGAHALTVELGALRRGLWCLGPLTVRSGDPFGLVGRDTALSDPAELCVHPRTIPLRIDGLSRLREAEGKGSNASADDELEFQSLREYKPGDDPKRIHWPSCARSDDLMVRRYEETRHMAAALRIDMSADSYADDEEFELAVSAYASLGRTWLATGHPVLTMHTDGCTQVTDIRTFMGSCSRLMPMRTARHNRQMTHHERQDTAFAVAVTGSSVCAQHMAELVSALPQAPHRLLLQVNRRNQTNQRFHNGILTASISTLDELSRVLGALP